MHKIKKCLSILLATVLFMSIVSSSYATSSDVMPYMEHISYGRCSLNINNSTASVSAWVQAYEDATKTEVSVEIQEQFLLFFWKTVDTWSSSSNGPYCRVSGSTSATSGNVYRAVATVTAWVGNDSETQTITTETVVAD